MGKFTFMLTLFFSLWLANAKGQNCAAGFNYWGTNGYTVAFSDSSFYNFGADSLLTSWWDFGDTTTTADTITGTQVNYTYLAPGVYTVCHAITTINGCSDTICMSITVSFACNLTVIVDTLPNGNGLQAVVSGGSAPYTFLWSTGATTASITGLSPGVYTVTVTDANNCTESATSSYNMNDCTITFWAGQDSSSQVTIYTYTTADSTYTDFGDGNGMANIPTWFHYSYTASGTYAVCVSAFNNGILCDYKCDTIVYQSFNAVICGEVFIDLNANGIKDNNEVGAVNQNVGLISSNWQIFGQTNTNGQFSINIAPGNYSLYYYLNQPNYTITFPPIIGNYLYTNIAVSDSDTICGFMIGIAPSTVHIKGFVFADLNANGVKNGTDIPIPNQAVVIGFQNYFTDNTGEYDAFLPVGTYNVSYTPQAPVNNYPLTTPSMLSVAAAVPGNTYGGNNFGLDIPNNSIDLAVEIVANASPIPGFIRTYTIIVTNNSVTPTAYTLYMTYDAALQFPYAIPTQASHNSVTHELTWNGPVLSPFTKAYFVVKLFVPTNVLLGTVVSQSASVTPTSGTDIDLYDNQSTISQTVVGSYDPNNKLVTSTNYADSKYQLVASANADQEINYVINFQNTGTAPAVTVIIVDTLDANLDETSFKFLSSSHNCQVLRTGRQVIYKFAQIMLPDSNSNEPQSHGFVSFSVSAKSNLLSQTVLSDYANIYFDFNAPVATNFTNVTLVDPLSIAENNNTLDANVFPNPATNEAAITIQNKMEAQATIVITDAIGRLIFNQEVLLKEGAQTIPIDVNKMQGVYTITVTTYTGRVILPLIVK